MEDYINLFKLICNSVESYAERALELGLDEQTFAGQQMRNDFAELGDKLSQQNFNMKNITRNEWLKLLAGAMITVNNMTDQMKRLENTIHGYKTIIVPRLSRIMDETKTDEEAQKLAFELFENSENE